MLKMYVAMIPNMTPMNIRPTASIGEAPPPNDWREAVHGKPVVKYSTIPAVVSAII
jgi:hypothetical protein